MNCLIVDDDDITRMEVERMVKKTPFLKLVKSCTDAMQAYNLITQDHVDLVFLDVMMPGMSGLELMKSLYKEKPHVILMTLNREYALEAFDYDVTDFLMKPISEDRFFKAVSKAKRIYDNEHKNGNLKNYFFANQDKILVKICMEEILYVESLENYVSVVTDSARHVLHSTLKVVFNKLSEKDFMRVHASYIVRLDKISKIEGYSIIINKSIVPLSRDSKDELMRRLNFL